MSAPKASPTPEVHHPLFARLFDRLSRLMEREVAAHRDALLSGLSGRVVEIGAGNGIYFRHYSTAVEAVVAFEPEDYLRRKAEEAAAGAQVAVSVRDGTAHPLPLEDGAFDAAVASIVLCTVPDQAAALAELRRVLKPGGELRFMEHVRAKNRRKARLQRWLDRRASGRGWPAAATAHATRSGRSRRPASWSSASAISTSAPRG